MKKRPYAISDRRGFTLIEILIIVFLLMALAVIAIPSYNAWMPSYELKRAGRDLYSNLQLAKLEAIKQNADCAFTVDTGAGSYHIDLLDRTVSLGGYRSGIRLADTGNITTTITFSSRGMAAFSPNPADNIGKVFITNLKGSPVYRLEITRVGSIRLTRE